MVHHLDIAKGLVLLSEAMSHAMQATQDGQLIVKSSDKTWSTGGGSGKPLQYSCLKNFMNSMKRQKIWHQKTSPCRSEGVWYAVGEEQRKSSRKNEEAKKMLSSGYVQGWK